MEETRKIEKDMMIQDVIGKYPDAANIFLMYGLHCIGCGISAYETIEQGARGHGMDDEVIEMMIRDANQIVDAVEKGELVLE